MRKFENEYTTMWIEDGILFTTYKSGLIITLEIAKKCVQARLDFCEGETYPLLGDISNILSTEREARAYLSKDEGIKQLSAGAFIIKSVLEQHLGNFFIQINNPPLPARLFRKVSDAIQWLEPYKKV